MNETSYSQKGRLLIFLLPLAVFSVSLFFFATPTSTNRMLGLGLNVFSIAITTFLVFRKHWQVRKQHDGINRLQLIRNMASDALILLAVLGVIFGVLYVFDPFVEQVVWYPTSINIFQERGAYGIEPEIILESLHHETANVFLPQLEVPEKYTRPSNSDTILWKQLDYIRVADALHQFVWQEKLDEWDLAEASFATSCENALKGFSVGGFIFYKTIVSQRIKIQYAAREIDIRLPDRIVEFGGGTTFPHPVFHGWKSIDLSRAITAEEALRIAEENGGRAARLAIQNNCTIRLFLNRRNGWKIVYDDNRLGTQGNLVEIQIDPYSGKVDTE